MNDVNMLNPGQAFGVLLKSTNVHYIKSLKTRVFYVRFQSNFYLFIHNESRYVFTDIAASDFDINRCQFNISAAYFSAICVSFARESQYS